MSRTLDDCFRLLRRHQNTLATLVTGATLHEVLSKFSSALRIPASQANPYINDTDWLGSMESENLRKTCTQMSCKVVSVLVTKSCPHLGRSPDANLNGQFVIAAIWRIAKWLSTISRSNKNYTTAMVNLWSDSPVYISNLSVLRDL